MNKRSQYIAIGTALAFLISPLTAMGQTSTTMDKEKPAATTPAKPATPATPAKPGVKSVTPATPATPAKPETKSEKKKDKGGYHLFKRDKDDKK